MCLLLFNKQHLFGDNNQFHAKHYNNTNNNNNNNNNDIESPTLEDKMT